jgi:hypothetical protein
LLSCDDQQQSHDDRVTDTMQYNITFFINHCHGLWRTRVT